MLNVNVEANGTGTFMWFDADPLYRSEHGFRDAWRTPRPAEELWTQWPLVESYLDLVIPAVPKHLTEKEGMVHAAICSAVGPYRVIDRECQPAFASDYDRVSLEAGIGDRLRAAIAADPCTDNWWPGIRYASKPKTFGTSPDMVALDDIGRLLVIEAKPAAATDGITWGPAQVRFYADMWAHVLKESPEVSEVLSSMLKTRVDLGLSPNGRVDLAKPLKVVPILAIGTGRASRNAIKRAAMVQEAIDRSAKNKSPVAKTEFWLLDRVGVPSVVLV